jgi:pimeloyl-ACP methyl ester carboxylesterase
MPARATEPFALELPGGGTLRGDRLAGEGPAYVYLHGLGSVRAGEKSESLLAHARARGRAFLRLDQRGHGESSGVLGRVAVSELIADLRVLLERIGPAVVVGSSLGGLVGAFGAAASPELVRGLCLLAPAIGIATELEHLLDSEGLLRTSEGVTFHVQPHVVADAQRLDEAGLPARLSMPTLVVHGSLDDIVPPRNSERLFASIPHDRKALWVVPGGDHRLNAVAAESWPRLDRLLGG